MDNATILVAVLVALVGLMAMFLFATARRRDTDRALEGTPRKADLTEDAHHLPVPVGAPPRTGREIERSVALQRAGRAAPDVAAPPPPPAIPPDEESLGITRRQVLNRGIVTTMVLAITGFSGSMLAMLWPTLSGGFGARIRAGRADEIIESIETSRDPYYVGAGRFYLQLYPEDAVPAARNVPAYAAVVDGYEDGFVALYQKCPHLGCRVPWCTTSQWFECPCHGSQYNRVGEKKGGPAPRGMDRFVVSVDNGVVTVDTGLVIPGPAIGVNTTGQEAEGPHCIGSTEGGH